jgi:hypothetical protein
MSKLPGTREILIPHDPSRGELKAVRRMLVHSSLAELKALGLYERYTGCVDPQSLGAILDQIGPGWLSTELALAHYRACDDIGINDADVEQLGATAGEKLARTLTVPTASSGPESALSPWSLVGAFERLGKRIYDGGSIQYVKLGPMQLSIENIGNPLFSVHYYRVAHLAFMRRSFETLGASVIEARITNYRVSGAMIEVSLAWE